MRTQIRPPAQLGGATILLALMSAGCLGKTGDTGGETHWQKSWLSACVAEDDCAPGLECLAGFCTIRCRDDAGCEGLDDAACKDLGAARACAPAACGNGVLDPGEVCDDGNLIAGDGCAANCLDDEAVDEPRADATDGDASTGDASGDTGAGDATPDVRPPDTGVCGDGVVDVGEQCDDANLMNGDGCSADCRIEACGNGVLDPGEQCDDANNLDADGCSALCTLEVCGNGVVDPGEQCDDGNLMNGDGCSSACTIEG